MTLEDMFREYKLRKANETAESLGLTPLDGSVEVGSENEWSPLEGHLCCADAKGMLWCIPFDRNKLISILPPNEWRRKA